MRLGCLQITRKTTTTTTTPTTITPYSAVTTTTTTTTITIFLRYWEWEERRGQRRLCTKDVVYPWKHRSHRVLFYSHFPLLLAAAHTDVDLFCCLFNSGCNGVVYSTPRREYLSKRPRRPVAEQEIIRLTTKAKMNSAAAAQTG